MKNLLKKVFGLGLSALLSVACFGCSNSGNLLNDALLQRSAKAEELSYKQQTSESLNAFRWKADNFSARFSETAFSVYKKEENFTVSPVSVFAALALATECSAGNTRTELLSTLGVNYEELKDGIGTLYRSLNETYQQMGVDGKEKTLGMVRLSNSIWLQKGVKAKQLCLNDLSNDYYCDSYTVDFAGENDNANKAVRQFAKEKTKGLIDKDFRLSKATVFALMNTLYLKDVWNTEGADLTLTQKEYSFTSEKGNSKSERFLQGRYLAGRAYKTDRYSAFYTSTINGYKIKFIVPETGYTVADVFTAQTLETVNGLRTWREADEDTKTEYYTRCIFPEYEASYDEDIIPLLSSMGINDLFKPSCNMSNLTDTPVVCDSVQHATKLKVNRKGIEGAAVTIMQGSKNSAPSERKIVYEDFLVDKSFGFILTDRYGVALFSGVVKNI